MLAYPASAKIFLFASPIDLRNGFEGLSFLIESVLKEQVISGAYFVFINKRRNLMKILYWDGDGLALWLKRLERGLFAKLTTSEPLIDRRRFLMLLEGVTPRRLNTRYKAV
jgi:transposase